MATAAAVVAVVIVVIVQDRVRPEARIESTLPPLPEETQALLEQTEPSPDCIGEPRDRSEGATIALDVVKVDGTCFDVETVWTTEEQVDEAMAELAAEPGVIGVSRTPEVELLDAEEFRSDQWGLDVIGADSQVSNPWPAWAMGAGRVRMAPGHRGQSCGHHAAGVGRRRDLPRIRRVRHGRGSGDVAVRDRQDAMGGRNPHHRGLQMDPIRLRRIKRLCGPELLVGNLN